MYNNLEFSKIPVFPSIPMIIRPVDYLLFNASISEQWSICCEQKGDKSVSLFFQWIVKKNEKWNTNWRTYNFLYIAYFCSITDLTALQGCCHLSLCPSDILK